MNAFDFMSSSGLYMEIGQSSLKVLDGDDGLELSLERLENGRLDPQCAERLTASLRVFLKKHNWRPRLRAFCAIGARGVSLRRLTLPLAGPEELHQLLLFQIEREFPLPPDELAWGYRPLNGHSPGLAPTPASANKAGGVQEVVVVAVKKEVLQEYFEILSGCGLSPVFTLSALAQSAICPHPPASYAVLDIGRTHSELISFENGDPKSIRVLPWGGENITQTIEKRLAVGHAEAERLKIHFEDELSSKGDLSQTIRTAIDGELSSLAVSIQTHWLGQKLYLAGRSARFRNIAPQLAGLITGVECERLEIMPGEARSAAILGLKKSCEQEGQPPPLILQPTTERKSEHVAQSVPWKWAALACLLAIVSLSLRYGEPLLLKPRLSRRLSELKAHREKLPSIDREVSFLQFLKTNQPPYLDLLNVLANGAPPGTRFETLSLNRRGDLSLRTGVRDSQQIVDFRSKLIESGHFSSVVVEEQTPTPDRQKITVRMTGEWKPLAEGKSLPVETRRAESERSRGPVMEMGPGAVGEMGRPLPGPARTVAPRREAKE